MAAPMTFVEILQLIGTGAAVLAALSSFAATLASWKTLKKAADAQARSIAAQNRVNEVLEEDIRYRKWIEDKLAEWTDKGWTQPTVKPENLDERRFLARAVREGVIEKTTTSHAYRIA